MNKVYKYYLSQYDSRTPIEVIHPYQRNKIQTKFISNEFHEDF